jgi:hypothetical protein
MNWATNKLQLEENSVKLIVPDLGSLFETIPVTGDLDAFSIGDALREASEQSTVRFTFQESGGDIERGHEVTEGSAEVTDHRGDNVRGRGRVSLLVVYSGYLGVSADDEPGLTLDGIVGVYRHI